MPSDHTFGSRSSVSHTVPAPPPAPVQHSLGLAVASLVLGIIALVGSALPVLNIGSVVLAVIACGLGAVSLLTRRGGRGMAISGIVVSVVAIGVAILVNVVTAVFFANTDSAGPDVASGSAADQSVPGNAATSEALELGTPATVGDYTVTVAAVLTDANQVIADTNPFNEPPTGRYVLVDLTVTNNGQEEAAPWIDVTTEFQGTDARNYSTSSCSAVVPTMGILQPNLRPTGTSSYQVCFDVPGEAVDGGVVAVEQFGNFSDDQVFWKLQ